MQTQFVNVFLERLIQLNISANLNKFIWNITKNCAIEMTMRYPDYQIIKSSFYFIQKNSEKGLYWKISHCLLNSFKGNPLWLLL